MNSEKFMPFDVIAPNMFKNNELVSEYYHGLNLDGTGFFVYFPPYETEIFYVTTRHSILQNANKPLLIRYASYYRHDKGYSDLGFVEFSEQFQVSDTKNNEIEDVSIFVVDRNISQLKRCVLLQRSLKLPHSDTVSIFLESLSSSKINGKVRLIGYPAISETEIIEDDKGNPILKLHPRGLNGWLEKDTHGIYKIIETNWQGERLGGFSGSPILALPTDINTAKTDVLLLGMLIAGHNELKEVKFIPIDIITQAISCFLLDNGYISSE